MNDHQEAALRDLCERYGVFFDEKDYIPQFDLPPGYVAGWIGGAEHAPGGMEKNTIYVGVSAGGQVSS